MTPVFAHMAVGFAPFEIVPITAAAVLYWHRAMTLSWDGRPVPAWRQVCFGGGLFLIAFALFSPLGHVSEELVIAHMIEHLLIGDFASLLLVLGLTKSLLQPILAIKLFNRLQILAHPVVAFVLWTVNLLFWHLPAMYQEAYGMGVVHALEHSLFLFFGCMMWMSIFGPLPTPTWFTQGWKVAYVFAVRLVGALLGNFIAWSGAVLYPIYEEGAAYWGISPLADQGVAGMIMMVEGTFLALGVLAWVFFEAAREGIEKQRLLDLAYERGIELDPVRAQRAVAGRHTELLEKRLRAQGTDPPATRENDPEPTHP